MNEIACKRYEEANAKIEELKRHKKPTPDHILLYKILENNMDFFKGELKGESNYLKHQMLFNYIRNKNIMFVSSDVYKHYLITRLLFRNGIFKPLVYAFIEMLINFLIAGGLIWLLDKYMKNISLFAFIIATVILAVILFLSGIMVKINFYIVRESK